MNVYETTFFSRQKTRSLALAALRAAINAVLVAFRATPAGAGFGGYAPVVSAAAKTAIRAACGNPQTANTHVYEIGISGHWRIFFAQGVSGGIVVLMVGHLNGNVVEQP